MKKEADKTRDLVVRAILERGPATAVELADRLEITPAGIRRHLDALIADGTLQAREAHSSSSHSRGRGRPSKVFVMTDGGREKFENSYDDLAASALRFISKNGNRSEIKKFARERAEEFEKRALNKLKQPSKSTKNNVKAKAESLAKLLTEDGYLSTVNHNAIGIEVCQHHCPVAHVASEFPELCEAELEVMSRMLGTHVQRLATIANGDGVCTTFVPTISPEAARKPLAASKGARQ